VSNFTYRNIIILMETIKNLYKRLLDHPARPREGEGGHAPFGDRPPAPPSGTSHAVAGLLHT
jgi:hypothetical protein